mgnify:CR=1 FL=1
MSRKAAIEAFNKNPTLEKLNLITGGSDIGVNVGAPSLAKGKKIIERGGKQFVTDSDIVKSCCSKEPCLNKQKNPVFGEVSPAPSVL